MEPTNAVDIVAQQAVDMHIVPLAEWKALLHGNNIKQCLMVPDTALEQLVILRARSIRAVCGHTQTINIQRHRLMEKF